MAQARFTNPDVSPNVVANIYSDRMDRGGFDQTGTYNRDIPVPKFDIELHIVGPGAHDYERHGVGIVPAGQMGRQEHYGKLVAGPFGFGFGLATVLSATPMPKRESVDVRIGDWIRLDGVDFRVERLPGRERERYIQLVNMTPPGPSQEDAERWAAGWRKSHVSMANDGCSAATITFGGRCLSCGFGG